MPTPLNILIVEDSPDDAALLIDELQTAGFDPKWKRVQTEPEFRDSLNSSLDLILSDYSMPKFSGLRAVDLLRESGLDIPFILVSGTIGEEKAVEAMRHGIADYLLKDRIGRLGNAVERALEQKRLREYHRQMQHEMKLQATALDTAANGIVITDRAGSIIWVNSAFTALTGYSAAEVVGRTPRVLKSGLHDEKFYRDFWQTIISGQTWCGEFINRRKNGSIYHDAHTVTPVRSQSGKITHFVGIMLDLTEYKHIEEQLKESEERYRTLIEQARDAVFTLKPDTTIASLNRAFEIITGFKCEEWVGRPFSPLIHPDDLPRAIEIFRRVMQNEKPPQFELRIRTRAGSVVTLEFTMTPYRQGKAVTSMMGIGRDVTERKQLEQQFRQAQKMESIGQLAGGVAHDFNNILTVIQGHASLTLLDSTLSTETKESAEQISLAAERAAGLTRQLLTFSRRQVIDSRELDLNGVIEGVTKMLGRLLGEDIALEFDGGKSPPILADAGMLEQVLMNLAVNARDAMPEGGVLKIQTGAETITEAFAQQNPEASRGDFVWMEISDTGCGIPPENLSKIFEPFFTTKEVGKGTGLGLATVYGIVKQHRGWITLHSKVNQGTTFKIYLPASAGRGETARALDAEENIRGGTETILLVEDEAPLRQLVRNVLESYRYKVIDADSGRAALDEWEKNAGEIDLLLTDLVMPGGLNGRDLGEKLRLINPRLRIVFMSGYSGDIVGKDFKLREGINFLQKPFAPRTLAKCVRDCLDGGS